MRDDRRKIITDGTTDLSITVAGAAKIDGSAVVQPTILKDSSSNNQISAPTALSNKIYYGAVTGTLVASGTEAPMVLFRNPVGSGKKLHILSISVSITANGVLSAQDIFTRLKLAPTITTTGTAGTIVSGHPGGGAAASAMTIFSQPTLSATGTLIGVAWTNSGASGGVVGEYDLKDQLILEAAQDLCVTGTPDGTNRAFSLIIRWFEE